MISGDPAVNPQMYSWNRVFVGYCDGGSYSGAVTDPVNVGGSTIYYRGRFILDAVYTELFALGLSTATDVVIKGCSAGGLAVYLHADYLSDRIHAVNPAARVVASPGAGFFMDVTAFSGEKIYTPNYQWVFARMNTSGFVNQACIAAYAGTSDTWKCFMAP